MQNVTEKAKLREMSADELQDYADELYTKCDGELLLLSDDEFLAFGTCCNNYFSVTGEPLKAKSLSPDFKIN